MRRSILLSSFAMVLWAPAASADDAPVATAPASATATEPPVSNASATKTERKTEVILHVASPEKVPVEKTDTGEVVCMSPCDAPVPATGEYRIGGGRPSHSFTLNANDGKAALKVKPASKTSYYLGVGGIALGTAVLATGAGILLYAVANRAPIGGPDGVDTDNTYQDRITGGILVSISGVVVGLWGLATMVSNTSTSVRGDMTTRRNDSGRTSGTARALPTSTYLPLLGGAF